MDPTLGFRWDRGFRGLPTAPAMRLGDAAAFAGDADQQTADGGPATVLGVNEACWTNFNVPFTTPDQLFAFDSCCLLQALARCMQDTYDINAAPLVAFWRAMFGPQTVTLVEPEVGLFPTICIVKHPALAVAIVSGTTNFDQLSQQALKSGAGPKDFGLYGTNQQWHDCSDYVFLKMVDFGIAETVPWLIVGHSYGAAAATIMAARRRISLPAFRTGLICFGSPKPGDQRLINLLDPRLTLSIENTGDVVCSLPPTLAELGPMAGLLLPLIGINWDRWKTHARVLSVDANGGKTWRQRVPFDVEVLLPLVQQFVAMGQVNPIAPHGNPEYVRRLGLQCDGPCFPIRDEAWRILMNAPAAAAAEWDGPVPASRESFVFVTKQVSEGVVDVLGTPLPAAGQGGAGDVLWTSPSELDALGGILMEDSGYVLQEDGSHILME